MTFNTFTSGVNTTFSSELNTNFNILRYGNLTSFETNHYVGALAENFGNNAFIMKVDGILSSTDNMTSGVASTTGAFSGTTYSVGFGSNVSTLYTEFDYSIFKRLNEAGISAARNSGGSGAGTTRSSDSSNLLQGEGVVYFSYNIANNAIDAGSGTGIQLYDGTNGLNIKQTGGGSINGTTGFIELFLDWANKRVIVNDYIDTTTVAGVTSPTRTLTTSYLSASALVGSAYLSVYATVDASGGNCASSASKIRGKKTTTASTVNLKVSGDGGSNFTTLSNNPDVLAIGVVGSNLVFRIDGTLDSTEVLEWDYTKFKYVN